MAGFAQVVQPSTLLPITAEPYMFAMDGRIRMARLRATVAARSAAVVAAAVAPQHVEISFPSSLTTQGVMFGVVSSFADACTESIRDAIRDALDACESEWQSEEGAGSTGAPTGGKSADRADAGAQALGTV